MKMSKIYLFLCIYLRLSWKWYETGPVCYGSLIRSHR